MKLESTTEEHQTELSKAKEESFAEGLKAGKKQVLEDGEVNYSKGLEQFSSSVATLESTAKEFDSALEGIKKELISKELTGIILHLF